MISNEAQLIKSALVRDTLDGTPIEEKRQQWEQYASTVKTPANVKVKVLAIAGIPCMLLQPSACSSNSVVVYVHGGGLVEGSVNTSREWCARLALAVNQPVLSIDYRLAPEYPFPAALDDVVAVLRAVVDDETDFTVSSIGADSSGCAVALQALIVLRDSGCRLPGSCFLLSPSVDFTFSGGSMETNIETDLVVASEVLKFYARLYVGDTDPASADVSPLFAKLCSLPRLLVHCDGSELLLDDAIRLERLVAKEGGDVQLIVEQGLWHVWPAWGDFPEARTALQQIAAHINTAEYN